MAFSSTNPPVLLVGGALSGGWPRMFAYRSSHSSTAISGVTAFFVACGVRSRNHSPANVGMNVGDILLNQETTDGATPGKVTLHSVTASTASGSTLSSTLHYNVTVS